MTTEADRAGRDDNIARWAKLAIHLVRVRVRVKVKVRVKVRLKARLRLRLRLRLRFRRRVRRSPFTSTKVC